MAETNHEMIAVETTKPTKRGRPPKTEKKRTRTRATVVEVTLTGPLANWVKTEAAKNYRDHAGQIAFCVAQCMETDPHA